MRKWRPPDAPANKEWRVVHQIVVPPNYRKEILILAHGSIMAGHLGVHIKPITKFDMLLLARVEKRYRAVLLTLSCLSISEETQPNSPSCSFTFVESPLITC